MRVVDYTTTATALRRGAMVSLFVLGLLLVPPATHAQTADGYTPAQEQVCDSETGAMWGLCTAYCEAMDCDSEFPYADLEACERVFNNYVKQSGGDMPPCEMTLEEEAGTGTGEEGGTARMRAAARPRHHRLHKLTRARRPSCSAERPLPSCHVVHSFSVPAISTHAPFLLTKHRPILTPSYLALYFVASACSAHVVTTPSTPTL